MTRTVTVGTAVMLLAFGAGCGEGADGGDDAATLERVGYAATIQPIWDAHCVSCHRAGADLDLESAGSRERILAETGTCLEDGEVVEKPLVVPGDPGASVLWRKLANELDGFAYNREMPPNGLGGLREEDPEAFAAVEAWIAGGAPE